MTDEQTQKLTRLFLKIIAGIVFTDLEALPDGYIIMYAEKICNDIGEASDGNKILSGMVHYGIITKRSELNGQSYYTHNLPKTIQANHHVTNNFRTKGQRD
jgi:hypothetical protein